MRRCIAARVKGQGTGCWLPCVACSPGRRAGQRSFSCPPVFGGLNSWDENENPGRHDVVELALHQRAQPLIHVLYFSLRVEDAMGGFPFFHTGKCFWKCFKAGDKSAWVPLLPSLLAVSLDLPGARLWAPGGAPQRTRVRRCSGPNVPGPPAPWG